MKFYNEIEQGTALVKKRKVDPRQQDLFGGVSEPRRIDPSLDETFAKVYAAAANVIEGKLHELHLAANLTYMVEGSYMVVDSILQNILESSKFRCKKVGEFEVYPGAFEVVHEYTYVSISYYRFRKIVLGEVVKDLLFKI